MRFIMNIYFKKSLGMTDVFMLTTWDELDRINEVCDDYFIFRGYEIDDNKTGRYVIFLYRDRGYCVKESDIEYKHMILEPLGLRFNEGEEVIEFIDTCHNRGYTYCCDGRATELELASVRKCVESPSGLAHCTVAGFNVVSWEAVDD